jgi:Icc protein
VKQDRRNFLKCMAWAGTGLVWAMDGGVLSSHELLAAPKRKSGFNFVQISDSHIGFNRDPNHDVSKTLQEAVDKINALDERPAFVIHTGDITHLATAEQFDTAAQIMKSAKADQVYYVPGEHDVFTDDGKLYFERFGQKWRSFDYNGVHFIGLINVLNLKQGSGTGLGGSGLGQLGQEQLVWLQKDVKGLSSSTPVVVFAHIPLWTISLEWGWGTAESEQALSYLKRFGSVSVLNGHVHQVLQKVEGNVMFHTARSTAYPQPAPGTAPAPGPIKDLAADKLRSTLGVTDVSYMAKAGPLAVVDEALG